MASVPRGLRIWFRIHFLVDFLFAVPIFFAPEFTLQALGFATIDVFSARLVAAALFGIGGISLVASNREKETFDILLTLKIIWSFSAMVGIMISIFQREAPPIAWFFFAVFAIFAAVWIYYKNKII